MEEYSEDYVIFVIAGHENLVKVAATHRACGGDVEKTLQLLNWTRRRKAEQTQYLERKERSGDFHLKVQHLVDCYGFSDRDAFMSLNKYHGDIHTVLRAREDRRIKKKRQEKAEIKEVNPPEHIKSDENVKEEGPQEEANAENEVGEAMLDSLERTTLCNRGTCLKVYRECMADYDETVLRLRKHRDNARQRLMRSDERRQHRERKQEELEKLMALTGYDQDRCEKILAYFGGSYNKAEKQYEKFQDKKKGGEKLSVDTEEDNLMTDFKIRELELSERRDLEQYFFSRDTLVDLIKVMDQFDNPCCMVCPSVAHASHALNRELTLLDIDERFSYLPRYINYNLYKPSPLTQTFDMILFDPPYFQVPMYDLINSVDVVSHHNRETPIIVAFLRRSQANLLKTFAPYDLRPTRYHPGYAHVKDNKRKNYLFYSNWDGLPNNAKQYQI